MILRCMSCKKTFNPKKGLMTCDQCGDLYGTLEVLYDYEAIRKNRPSYSYHSSVFDWGPLLPIKSHTVLDKTIGSTPLYHFKHLEFIDHLMIKNDGLLYSGSLKDRASIVAINRCIEEGYDTIACASTGNAAASLALLSAHTHLKTEIFIPKHTPKGKLNQLKLSGANLHVVDGSYEKAFETSMIEIKKNHWYTRNSAINPYLLEGKKTVAFEILVQNKLKVPDYCFVSVGDGTIISGVIKGFEEFKAIGLIDQVPRVIGVQSEKSKNIYLTFKKGPPYQLVLEPAITLADSISVDQPRDFLKACIYMERNGGHYMTVKDEEILMAIKEMTELTGVFAEPAGATSYAGLKKMIKEGTIKKSDQVVVLVSGSGLKDPNAYEKGLKDGIFKI